MQPTIARQILLLTVALTANAWSDRAHADEDETRSLSTGVDHAFEDAYGIHPVHYSRRHLRSHRFHRPHHRRYGFRGYYWPHRGYTRRGFRSGSHFRPYGHYHGRRYWRH